MANIGAVHEPEAELLTAEEAIGDAVRLRQTLAERRREYEVPLRVPLVALLEAIDHLDQQALRQIIERAEERLVVGT
jgi:hypothetical protein